VLISEPLSNSIQTLRVSGVRFRANGPHLSAGSIMSYRNQSAPVAVVRSSTSVYLENAAAALHWSYAAKTEDRKKDFLNLARMWARAAMHPEAPWGNSGQP
jgi:hypothetical protein